MEEYSFKAVSDLVFTDDFMFGAARTACFSICESLKFVKDSLLKGTDYAELNFLHS